MEIVCVRQIQESSGVPHLIDKDMVKESVSRMKNGTAAGSPDLVSEMVKSAEKAGSYTI